MGAEPWDYFVPFEASVDAALERLCQQVFESGRYRGSELKPATREEAFQNMDADGTASVLDILGTSETPDFCSVCPLPDARLIALFGTTRPDHQAVKSRPDLFDAIERGQGVYVVVYKQDAPDEYYFAGYSFD